MRQFEQIFRLRRICCVVAVFIFSLPLPSNGQDKSVALTEKMLTQAQAGSQTGVLTLDDAVLIALQNQPRIKGAQERIGAQQAVVGQEMSAYYPAVSLGHTYGASTSPGQQKPEQETSAGAELDFILYDFGKREGAVQSARNTLNARRFDHRATADEVILDVKESFYLFLAAQALVRVREEAVKSRELLVRQARGFFEVGTRPKIDVARAESNLYNARADLISAENAVRIGLATLRNAMGVAELPGVPVLPQLAITPPPLTLEQARETAYAARAELKSFEAQRRAQDEKIATTRRGHLPDIVFNASGGRANEGPIIRSPLKSFWGVGVALNLPLFEGFRTTYRVQEEMRNYYVIRAQEEETKQAVALEVETSYLRLVESEERIKATEAALTAARENLDLANGRYQVGVGTIIEVTDAQTLYTDAQTSNIQSIYDYKTAEAQLIRAMGQR